MLQWIKLYGMRMEDEVDFYKMMQEAPKHKKLTRVVLLDGEQEGKQGLFCDGNCMAQEDGFFVTDRVREAVKKATAVQNVIIDEQNYFIEPFSRSNRLILCGAGHISIAVITMANQLGFETCVAEDRLLFAQNAQEAGASRVVCKPFAQALQELQEDDAAYYVIATRGHNHDQVCLETIATFPYQYVGMVGSKRRVKMVKSMAEEKGVSKQFLDDLHSPIGLPIHAETPPEIAVSIMAEIINEKNTLLGSVGFSDEIMNAIASEDKMGMALATIVQRKGSTPREMGAKMIVLANGDCIDTIGGGCVEAEVRQRALQCISDGKTVIQCVDMTAEQSEEEGMVCGGVVDVLIQPICHG